MERTTLGREDPDWVARAARAQIHYRVPGMDQVPVRRNLTYKTAEEEPLQFHLYSPHPANPQASPAPVVILIHGGPIPPNLLTTPKDWGLFDSYGRLLGASGLAAIMFNHRFFGFHLVRDAMADVQDLLEHVRANAGTLDIDSNRICLWAFSGGGPLLSPFLRKTPDSLRCVVAYYSALHATTPDLSAADQLAENTGRIPPLLVARAGLDMPPLNEGIDRFVQQALRKNASLDLLNHPSGQHAFDVRDDNERTRDILGRTVEFLRFHLG